MTGLQPDIEELVRFHGMPAGIASTTPRYCYTNVISPVSDRIFQQLKNSPDFIIITFVVRPGADALRGNKLCPLKG